MSNYKCLLPKFVSKICFCQHCTIVSNLLQVKKIDGGRGRESGEPGIYIGKVKVLVAQSCLSLGDPMDCGPAGSSVHGILQTILESGNIPDPGMEPGSPHCRQILPHLSHQGSSLY